MVLDTMTAIGLAGNIVQFVEIGSKVISAFVEIHHSVEGSLKSNDELELIARDLKNLLHVLSADPQIAGDPDWSGLCNESLALAGNLITMLEGLKPSNRKRLESLKASVKVIWNRSRIRDLESRIWKLRGEICVKLNTLLFQQRTELSKSVGDLGDSLKGWRLATEKKLDILVESLSGIERFDTKNAPKNAPERAREAFSSFAELFQAHLRQTQQQTRIRQILQSLYFKQIRARESEIRPAHQTTFEWIFKVDSRTKFVTWLQQTNDTYWISGKAGSGKSTLMKFLLSHETTHQLLRSWAGPKKLLVASHFFWSSGTNLQKSQEGLFRTLLFQILIQRPNLAPLACPKRWDPSGYDDLEAWTLSELIESFSALSKQELEVRVCLFIDGLDEYRGDHNELVKVLRVISQSLDIKICASSRPWIPFLKAFEHNSWQMAVQDLTRKDILVYINDSLEVSEHFRFLRQAYAAMASSLISQITTRAQGVFLWVYLVVRSLLRGLDNYDSLADLHRRLDDLPDELEQYFKLMLDTIENVYVKKTARVFKTLTQANSALPVITFSFIDQEELRPNYALEPTDFASDTCPEIREAEALKMHQLVAQCRDLVHITHSLEEKFPWTHTVGFLHRTVADFLQTQDVATLIAQRAGDYDARRSLCRAYLAQLKVPTTKSGNELTIFARSLAASIIYNAREIEIFHGRSEVEALDALNSVVLKLKGSQEGWSEVVGIPRCMSILHLATRCGMSCYVRSSIPVDKNQARPALLREALRRGIIVEEGSGFSEMDFNKIDLTMAEKLIQWGSSPNHLIPSRNATVWEDFLSEMQRSLAWGSNVWDMSRFLPSEVSKYQFMSKDCAYEICRLMIANGAVEKVKIGAAISTKALTEARVSAGILAEARIDAFIEADRAKGSEDFHVQALFEEFFTDQQTVSLMALFPKEERKSETYGGNSGFFSGVWAYLRPQG